MNTKHYQQNTLVDVAYVALKKDIAERVFLPGQKLLTRELSERYSISETPIKQALNRLLIEGLMENTPRKGFRVRILPWDEIEELMDIRLMIETYYAKQIIDNLKNRLDIKERMQNVLNEHMRVVEESESFNEYFRYYHLDQEFHQLFITCSENKKVTQIYANLGTHVYSHYMYGRQTKEDIIPGAREHVEIYNALVAGDETRLRNAIEAHIVNSKNRNRKIFTGRES